MEKLLKTENNKSNLSASEKKLSLGLITLGCAKNLVDSQMLLHFAMKNGVQLASRPDEADILLINTCSFIADARDESYSVISKACELKKSGKYKAIVVAGCMPQRYKRRLYNELPDVDAFLGLDDLDKIAEIVNRLGNGETRIFEVSDTSSRLYEPPELPVILTGGPFAYIKIAEGCNHRCTFCAIPSFRGNYRSRTIDSIVREAETLLEHGFKELNLISQDTSFYGMDMKNGTNLAKLLRALGNIGGKFWIRLLYTYPTYVTDELLETMGEIPQVCHYLDVPIQHCEPELLKSMGRTDTIGYVNTVAEKARTIIQDIVLRTTCLVGFPGETDRHFQNLVEYLQKNQFDHLGVFVFSPEENTPSAKMKKMPSIKIAEKRRKILMQIQQEIVRNKNARLVGTEDEVLMEQPVKGYENYWIARSYRLAPEVDGAVFVKIQNTPGSGDFVRVLYTDYEDYDMLAEPLSEQNGGNRI
jgi:ribosomal protein S12 methylthiotransferase